MRIFKKLIPAVLLTLSVLGMSSSVLAWDKAPNKQNDAATLQYGAKLFSNYCLSCHSAAFMRFNRLNDIGLSDDDIKENLLFTTDDVGDTMVAAIDPAQAKEWFGANPPDLSVIARSRAGAEGSGADYLYTLLRNYYRDDTRASGWNNMTFPNIGMPHPLWELQGERQPIFETIVRDNGDEKQVFTGEWEQLSPGMMTEGEYDEAVSALVNYMQWMAEPVRGERVRIGIAVMIFLVLFTLIAWRLNKAYWKDIE